MPPRLSIIQLAERLQEHGDENYEVEKLTVEECRELDSIVFECIECNNWFSQRDNANRGGTEWVCKECKS